MSTLVTEETLRAALLRTVDPERDKFHQGDLQRVLSMYPHLYIPPTISGSRIVQGAAMAEAILAIGGANLYPAEVTGNRRGKLLTNIVFFDDGHFNPFELNTTFDAYQTALRAALDTAVGQRGRITRVDWTRDTHPDALAYTVQGKVESPDDITRLTEPTNELHLELRKVVGEIRSVNGRMYSPPDTRPH